MQLLFPAHPLARRSGVRSRISDERAFTLIELLTVITIIGILMAIALGVFSGVKERAAVAQARSELASLSVSLESYKRQYGDYPYAAQFPVAGSAVVVPGVNIAAGTAQYDFFNAMAGLYGPWNYVTSTRATLTNGRAFVDLGKFTLELPGLPNPANGTPAANSFLDPWGRRYLYYYIPPVITSGVLTTPSKYVLYSVGPGSDLTSSQIQDSSPPTAAGIVDYTASANAKHIYANR